MIQLKFAIVFLVILLFANCNRIGDTSIECEAEGVVLYEYESKEARYLKIYDSGKAYEIKRGDCHFVIDYFDPNFFDNHFQLVNGETVFKIDTDFFQPILNFEVDFEDKQDFLDLFLTDISQSDKIFTAFTLQSPSAKTVTDYVALRKCILDQTCDFIDNRIDLGIDPENSTNKVLKFTAVKPSNDMVTSKTSIATGVTFFEKGDDFWFEARYFVDGEYPTTIADFESPFFEESPGPRLIFRGDQLAVENKFGDKLNFNQNVTSDLAFPKQEWVTVKVHLQYDTEAGIIQVWQNDELIIDAIGRNIPLDNWIQTKIEVGISATSEGTLLYMDDMRFSQDPF